MKIDLKTYVLESNQSQAASLQQRFAASGTLVLNIMGSPGAGKTAVLEQIIPRLRELSIAVIEGDVATDRDAARIARLAVPVIQINTAGACHLDAKMIAACAADLPDALDLLIIENIGNLVCPAEYDLGQDLKITVLSVPEGEDKPLKYPAMFRNSHAVILNKIDLLPLLEYNLAGVTEEILGIQPRAAVFPFSARTGEGVEALCQWLKDQAAAKHSGAA